MTIQLLNDNSSQFGVVDFMLRENKIEIKSVSEQVLSIMGIAAEKRGYFLQYPERFFSAVSEPESILREINANVSTLDKFTLFVKYTRPDESKAFVQANIKVVSKRDEAYFLSATLIDITGSAEKIYRENEKLSIVANLSADIVFEYIVSDDILKISFKEGSEFVLREEIFDFESLFKNKKIIHSSDLEVFEKLCDSVRLGKDIITAELRIFNTELDDYIWATINARTIFSENGKPVSVIGRLRNISKNKEAEMRLIDKAERDPLTKIYNKSTTMSLIKDYLRTDSRETNDALIIVDVDNFKAVNDNLGHLFGDSILIDLSQEMQDLFRTSDVVGRIGGDEFVVFLRGIKQKRHIEDKAADICRIFELLYSGEHEETITGSLGIAIFPQDGDTYDELFKKADIALYSSKNAGKNCYTFYSEQDTAYQDGLSKIHINRYRKDLPITGGTNLFDTEITDFAFEIMNKTTDVSSAINLLLSKVAKHFDLDRVSVIETIDEQLSIKYTYQWCSKSTQSQLGKIITFTSDQWNIILGNFDENDILMCNDTSSPEYASITEMFDDAVLKICPKALIQCAAYDSGAFKGCLSFHDCEKSRLWTVEEVRSFKTISKVIWSYLLKMRAFQKANQLVDRLTNYDNLTNLPRFNRFREIAGEYIRNADSEGRLALVYCDINNFKYLNEKYGSDNGDRLLKAFADNLEHADTLVKYLSRVFSDKFVALVRCDWERDLKVILQNAFDTFSKSEKLNYPDTNITVACGIYYIDSITDLDFTTAFDNVNIARKNAKEYIETTCIVYNEDMRKYIARTIEIVNEAKHALINREFVVYYQPKIGLKTNSLVGAEALVRWKKSDGRIIPPDQFIPYLERNGMIVHVDFYVYDEVCRFIRQHLDQNVPIVPISVNVSRIHLRDPRFLERVTEIVSKYRIPAHLLEFEPTESIFLENQSAAVYTMEEMKKLGFTVSIDDFGSGFSSLNLLKSLPVDILKIDKEFFANQTLQKNDQIVISSIISMASRMNIAVICEGVETYDQVEFLRESKCDMVQGYYYAKPITPDEFNSYSNKGLLK